MPILVTVDRSGPTMSYRLPALNATNLKTVLAPVLASDALPVSDANRPRGAVHPVAALQVPSAPIQPMLLPNV